MRKSLKNFSCSLSSKKKKKMPTNRDWWMLIEKKNSENIAETIKKILLKNNFSFFKQKLQNFKAFFCSQIWAIFNKTLLKDEKKNCLLLLRWGFFLRNNFQRIFPYRWKDESAIYQLMKFEFNRNSDFLHEYAFKKKMVDADK